MLPLQDARADFFLPPADEVAVKLKPGVNIQTILSRYNATQFGFLAETNLYFLKLNGQDANALLPLMNADVDLYYAEPNYYADSITGQARYIGGRIAYLNSVARYIGGRDAGVPAPSGDPVWAWQRVNRTDANKIASGQGVIVAVLDTGLAADHSLLQSSLTDGYDFVAMKSQILDQGNGIDDDGDGQIDEQTGHGTHVAGIILSAAPGVQIMPIRVLNSDGIGTYWELAKGIRYAVDRGAKVINMSLSAPLLPDCLNSALAYAAENDVVIVAAAGDGAGPNYPAGYSDPLAVIGVGATDVNDTVSWFSGGLLQDTDIYAPGVNIYSAFPYDEYVYASGTSMASPMIAAEAALLISRHPTWSAGQVAQRIIDEVDPIGLAAGRTNLGMALSTGLEVQYRVGDMASPTNAMIAPRLLLVNNTPQDRALQELTLRYWYTIDGVRPQSLICDYNSLSPCNTVTGVFGALPTTYPTTDVYAEIGFASAAGTLPAGGKVELLVHFHKDNWSDYNELNDYSYINGQGEFLPAPQISLYSNGMLAWGNEPVPGVLPSPTTSVPAASPTAMPTASPTALPQMTATSTSTQQPTATRTSTQAPTATRTPTQAVTVQPTSPPATLAPSATQQVPATATAQPEGGQEVVYDDASTWENWSWCATVNFNDTTQVYRGVKSLAFTFTCGWGGVSLHRPTPMSTAGYQSIRFWIYASGSGTRQMLLFTHNNNNVESVKVSLNVTAGQWTQVTVALSSLGNPTEVSRVNIQEAGGNVQPVIYVDDLEILP
ncbi:MAG: S8 family serine peptidase [Chloroflexota bacterium]